MLTPSWLFIAVDEGRGPSALAFSTAGLEIVDYDKTHGARVFEDYGLQLTGTLAGGITRTSYFLCLVPGLEAEAFARSLRDRVAARA